MKNIVLIGFMGTGKSSVGKILSKKLGFKFIDVDKVIEKTTGMKISEIFSRFGEPCFRDIESEVINLITQKNRQVIATGGGVVLREENMKKLKENGVIFCLKASENVIFERVKHCKDRPLLQVENPEKRIKELLEKRKHLYEKADFCIDTEGLTPEQVTEKIIERLTDGKT
ncbi:MAG: shikimate kinase [Thermodesulfovibrio sp.]